MEFKAFLIKYAEIGIKGNNRRFFEDALVRQMKYALKPCIWYCRNLSDRSGRR